MGVNEDPLNVRCTVDSTLTKLQYVKVAKPVLSKEQDKLCLKTPSSIVRYCLLLIPPYNTKSAIMPSPHLTTISFHTNKTQKPWWCQSVYWNAGKRAQAQAVWAMTLHAFHNRCHPAKRNSPPSRPHYMSQPAGNERALGYFEHWSIRVTLIWTNGNPCLHISKAVFL